MQVPRHHGLLHAKFRADRPKDTSVVANCFHLLLPLKWSLFLAVVSENGFVLMYFFLNFDLLPRYSSHTHQIWQVGGGGLGLASQRISNRSDQGISRRWLAGVLRALAGARGRLRVRVRVSPELEKCRPGVPRQKGSKQEESGRRTTPGGHARARGRGRGHAR